jgi:hypothetical protein
VHGAFVTSSSPFISGDTRLGDTRLGDTRLDDTRLGDTRLGDIRLFDAWLLFDAQVVRIPTQFLA